MVTHVIPAEIEAELEVVSPARQRHIVEKLVLADVAALREGALRVEPAERHRSRVHNLIGERALHQLRVLRELRHVVAERRRELVGRPRIENVCLLELHVVGRLNGDCIEIGADRIDRCGLRSCIVFVAERSVIVGSNLLIDLERQDPLRTMCARGRHEPLGARRSRRIVTRQNYRVAVAGVGEGISAGHARSTVPQPQHGLVGTGFGRVQGGHIVQNCRGERRRRNRLGIRVRQNKPHTFVVHEKERLVLADRSANR